MPNDFVAGTNQRRYCSQPKRELPHMIQGISDPIKSSAIITSRKKWAAGTNLTYFFFSDLTPHGPEEWKGSGSDISVVRSAFEVWMNIGLGISFTEVSTPEQAVLRIGFEQEAGSWSLVGTDNRSEKDPARRTMNFGWPLDDSYGNDTALHEVGHAIGMEHEHQNYNAGIEWNVQEVMNYFRGSPNFWDDDKIQRNVLDKLPEPETNGSNWDPDSIMEYWFGPKLISSPSQYRNGLFPAGGLSALDRQWALGWFPNGAHEMLQAGISKNLELAVGETKTFRFVPKITRAYTLYTIGKSDSTLVLFQSGDQGNVQIAADEDSGQDRNAQIIATLTAGEEYIIGLRLHYTTDTTKLRLIIEPS